MTQDFGRLAFTRRHGESFQVGEDTLVTIYRRSHERVAVVEVLRSDRTKQTLRIGQHEPFHPHPLAEVELLFDHGRGGSTRVKVTAPKSLKVFRSELITDAYKKAKAKRA